MSQPALEQILADWRESAQALRRSGHGPTAELVERICSDVAAAAEDYLTFLSEGDAILQSGRKKHWFRDRFPEWERGRHAYRDRHGRRFYRQLVVPRRADPVAARAEGQRSA